MEPVLQNLYMWSLAASMCATAAKDCSTSETHHPQLDATSHVLPYINGETPLSIRYILPHRLSLSQTDHEPLLQPLHPTTFLLVCIYMFKI